jgi:hypothetical protein
MINPNCVRNPDRVSKSKTAKEKVLAFVESHDRFRVWMCARGCSERASVVLPFLIALPNLQVASDGLCTKTSRSNGTKKATKKGDR